MSWFRSSSSLLIQSGSWTTSVKAVFYFCWSLIYHSLFLICPCDWSCKILLSNIPYWISCLAYLLNSTQFTLWHCKLRGWNNWNNTMLLLYPLFTISCCFKHIIPHLLLSKSWPFTSLFTSVLQYSVNAVPTYSSTRQVYSQLVARLKSTLAYWFMPSMSTNAGLPKEGWL